MSKRNPLRNATPENKNYKLYKAKKQWITACATFLLTLGATAAVNTNVQAATNPTSDGEEIEEVTSGSSAASSGSAASSSATSETGAQSSATSGSTAAKDSTASATPASATSSASQATSGSTVNSSATSSSASAATVANKETSAAPASSASQASGSATTTSTANTNQAKNASAAQSTTSVASGSTPTVKLDSAAGANQAKSAGDTVLLSTANLASQVMANSGQIGKLLETNAAEKTNVTINLGSIQGTKTYDDADFKFDANQDFSGITTREGTTITVPTDLTADDFTWYSGHQEDGEEVLLTGKPHNVGVYYGLLSASGLKKFNKSNPTLNVQNPSTDKKLSDNGFVATVKINPAVAHFSFNNSGSRGQNGKAVTIEELNHIGINATVTYPKDGNANHQETFDLQNGMFTWSSRSAPIKQGNYSIRAVTRGHGIDLFKQLVDQLCGTGYDPNDPTKVMSNVQVNPGTAAGSSFRGGQLTAPFKITLYGSQINYVDDDDNGKVVDYTTFGNNTAGTPVNVTYHIPDNYEYVSGEQPTYTFSATGTNAPITVHVKHSTKTLDNTSVIPHDGENTDGSALTESDFQKNITRTITAEEPTGDVDLSQQITLTRSATYDLVTKKVTSWGDWSTGKFDKVNAPTVDGYTPSQTSVKAVENVGTNNYVDPNIVITYKANTQSFIIKYVDADNNNAAISNSDQSVTDKQVGTTIIFNGTGDNSVKLNLPTNYVLDTDTDVNNPSSYKVTDDSNQTVTIHLKHKTQDVSATDPQAQQNRTLTVHYVNGKTGESMGNLAPDAQLQVHYHRTATKDLVTGKTTYGDWQWDNSYNSDGFTNGYHVVFGEWGTLDDNGNFVDGLPTSWNNVVVKVPTITGYTSFTHGDWEKNNDINQGPTSGTPANEFVFPTWAGVGVTINGQQQLYPETAPVYEATPTHTVYFVQDQNETRPITEHYEKLEEENGKLVDAGKMFDDESMEVFFDKSATGFATNGSSDPTKWTITWTNWQWNFKGGDKDTPGYHIISGTHWDMSSLAGAKVLDPKTGRPANTPSITINTPDAAGYTKVNNNGTWNTSYFGNPLQEENDAFTNDTNPVWFWRKNITTYYVPNSVLSKQVTRNIVINNPLTGRKQTVAQTYTFSRAALLNDNDDAVVFGNYDSNGKFVVDSWKNANNVVNGDGTWDAHNVAIDGYTALIDGTVGTEVAAKNDLTADTKDQTVNVTYIKNVANVTISGKEQDATYTGKGFTITADMANKISNAVAAADSRLTLPAGSNGVTLDQNDFSFVDDNGNTLTTAPTNVGTYRIILNSTGLKKFQNLDSNFTWNYDPSKSYVVFKVTPATPTSVTFTGVGSKTYDGSGTINNANFTTAPTISYDNLTGTNINFQTGDFEFVDSTGHDVTLAKINNTTGAVTGPINAGTYKIQLTAQGLQRIKDANPNFDLSNVTTTSVGTGTYTINKYAPVVTIEGSGQKTYDGKAVSSADVTKQDTDNTITIKLTVPKPDGSGNETVTYEYNYNPHEDYTSDYTWSDNGKTLETAPKNAGTYTITLKSSGVRDILNNMLKNDPNFSYLQGNVDNDNVKVGGQATYTIKQKALTIYLDGNGGKTYDASPATMPTDLASHLHADGLVNGDTLQTNTFDAADYTWYEKEADGTYKQISSPTNVGPYYIGILPAASTNNGVDTLARDNTNYAITIDYSRHYTYNITPAQGAITLNGSQTDTYSGVAHPISGYTLAISGAGVNSSDDQGKLQDGDLEFYVNGEWTANVPVNAGTYHVRLSQKAQNQLKNAFPNLTLKYVEGTGGPEGTTFTDYVINPSQVTLDFSGTSSKTYDGNAINVDYSLDNLKKYSNMSGVVLKQTLTYPDISKSDFEWVNDATGEVMTSVPKDAGSYTLRLKSGANDYLVRLGQSNPNYTFAIGKNAWNWTIGKAIATINFADNSGSQQTPWTGKATVLNPSNFTVSITTNNGQTLTVPAGSLTAGDFQFYENGRPIAVPTEIGNYTIGLTKSGLAKVESDTTNYNWVNTASGTYSITKAVATISLNGSSSTTYTGQAAVIPVDSNGNITGITVTLNNGKTYTLKRGDLQFVTKNADGTLTQASVPTDAGDYLVTLSQSGIDNINNSDDSTHYTYKLASNANTAKFTIKKADATITLTGTGSSTYGQTTSLSNGTYTIQLPGQSSTTTVDAKNLVFTDGVGR